MNKKLITVKELSTHINVSISTLYKWLRCCKVPGSIAVGRGRGRWMFDKKTVDECINKGEFKPDERCFF